MISHKIFFTYSIFVWGKKLNFCYINNHFFGYAQVQYRFLWLAISIHSLYLLYVKITGTFSTILIGKMIKLQIIFLFYQCRYAFKWKHDILIN